jgi:uncharacterized protein
MSTFVFRLKAPRPTCALDMNDEEREIMARHAAHWRPWIESGQMVIFGPVLDSTGSWGLGVVEADDEQELRAFAADDPVVTTDTVPSRSGRCWGASWGRGRAASRPGTGSASASDPPLSAALPARCRAPSAPLLAELALSRHPDPITHRKPLRHSAEILPNRNVYRPGSHSRVVVRRTS